MEGAGSRRARRGFRAWEQARSLGSGGEVGVLPHRTPAARAGPARGSEGVKRGL